MAFYAEAWVWPENPFSEMRWCPRPRVQLPAAHGGPEEGGDSGCPGHLGSTGPGQVGRSRKRMVLEP